MPLNAGVSDDLGALMARVPAKSALPRGPYAKNVRAQLRVIVKGSKFSPITIRGLRSPGAIPPEAPSLRLRSRGGRGCSVPPVLGRSSST